jgi:hypothetical protein
LRGSILGLTTNCLKERMEKQVDAVGRAFRALWLRASRGDIEDGRDEGHVLMWLALVAEMKLPVILVDAWSSTVGPQWFVGINPCKYKDTKQHNKQRPS